MAHTILLILTAFLMLVGCSTLNDTPYVHGSVIHAGGQHFFCPRHNSELVTVPGFDTGDGFVCVLPTKRYARLSQYYPNPIGLHGSLMRTYTHTRPVQITYCLRCEEELK